MTSITHYESVTLLALVLRLWRSWVPPRLSLNCIVFTALRSKLPLVCPMFSLLSTKEIPSGLKFWGWTWLCLLTTQSLQLLVSSLSLPLPYRDQWYQSIILRPIPQVLVDFRCNSSSLLSSYWDTTSPRHVRLGLSMFSEMTRQHWLLLMSLVRCQSFCHPGFCQCGSLLIEQIATLS